MLNDSKQFVFKLYAGMDRSYNQSANSYVVFSPKYDNLVNSEYFESSQNLKNVALIGGEGEGSERKYTSIGTASGLNRRELYVDARDISSDSGDDVTLTAEEYNAKLVQRGNEKLAECKESVTFDGEADTTRMYTYGDDFFNGDIVQVENEYGHSAAARITEIIMSEDESGISVYPTFKSTQEGA